MKKLLIAVACVIALSALTTIAYVGYQYWRLEPAKQLVRNSVKNPDGVRFRNLRATPAGAVCGEYNAQNGFGGYVGFRPFAKLPDGKGYMITRESPPRAEMRSLSSEQAADLFRQATWELEVASKIQAACG